MFPAKQPSKVVVRTLEGKEYSAYLEYPKGDPREPMTMEDLQAKFNALSESLLDEKHQSSLEKTIFNCQKMTTRDFMAALVV